MINGSECRIYLDGAMAMNRQGFTIVALEWFGIALEKTQELDDAATREGAMWHCMGMIQFQLGDLDCAVSMLERAVRLYENRLGKFHPDMICIADQLLQVYTTAQRTKKAEWTAEWMKKLKRLQPDSFKIAA